MASWSSRRDLLDIGRAGPRSGRSAPLLLVHLPGRQNRAEGCADGLEQASKPAGCRTVNTFFLLDAVSHAEIEARSPRITSRHFGSPPLRHTIDGGVARVRHLDRPEAVIAYEEDSSDERTRELICESRSPFDTGGGAGGTPRVPDSAARTSLPPSALDEALPPLAAAIDYADQKPNANFASSDIISGSAHAKCLQTEGFCERFVRGWVPGQPRRLNQHPQKRRRPSLLKAGSDQRHWTLRGNQSDRGRCCSAGRTGREARQKFIGVAGRRAAV